MADWLSIAIQAGGAVSVSGMFLWYLHKISISARDGQDTFIKHLETKDRSHSEAIDRQMQYLRDRDAQSKEIAQTGHDALKGIAVEVNKLSQKVDNITPECG